MHSSGDYTCKVVKWAPARSDCWPSAGAGKTVVKGGTEWKGVKPSWGVQNGGQVCGNGGGNGGRVSGDDRACQILFPPPFLLRFMPVKFLARVTAPFWSTRIMEL